MLTPTGSLDSGLAGVPIGFSQDGDLVFWAGCSGSGRLGLLRRDQSLEYLTVKATEARVTPDGVHLIAWAPAESLAAQRLEIRNLESGDVAHFEVDGAWTLTALGDDAYALLEGVRSGDDALQMIVVDLAEGWIGVVAAPT